MKSDLTRLVIFFLLLTVLISPWRNTSSQDDGAYVFSAIALAQGDGVRHAGTIAMNFPQFFVGTAALKILPMMPPISLLNFISWILYLGTVFMLYFYSGIRWTVLLGFFLFPIWIQYGVIYHGETYSAVLLVGLLVFLGKSESIQTSWVKLGLGFILSALLGSQLQNMAVFPFFWGCFLLLDSKPGRRALGISLIAGALTSIVAFGLMPKTPFQSAYSFWLMRMWTDRGPQLPYDIFCSLWQMAVCIGLYLFPLFHWKERSLKSWGLAAVVYAVSYFIVETASVSTMSAGVLFIDYLPRPATVGLLCLGVWGWWGAWPLMRNLREDRGLIPVWGTLAALLVTYFFSVFRYAMDLRYMMTWMIPVLFHLRGPLSRPIPIFGNRVFFLAPLVVVSVISNVYLMNTTDERWKAADQLVAQGADPQYIAAGYGWNVYTIASQCMYGTVEKLIREHGPTVWTQDIFYRRFLSQYGRSYEDEWVPRYIIKPSVVLGKKLDLTRYRLPGQDSQPVRFIEYSVLGIPNSLAVYENPTTKAAWCFQ